MRKPSRAGALRLCAGTAAMVLLACAGADAAAIHRAAGHPRALTAADVVTFREWSRYLDRGPSMWTKVEHPPVTPALWSAIWRSIRTDPGPDDPMVNYLLWKRSLNPARFDRYHHALAPALRRIRLARSSPTVVSQAHPTTTGPTTPKTKRPAQGTVPITSPQILVPTIAPEPSMLLLAAGMTGWAIRRFHRRS